MPDDLAGAHAAGVHRNDLLIEAGKATLVLGDQLRIERCLAVARDIQLNSAGLSRHRFAAVAVAAVAGLVIRQVMIHLRVQRPLGKRLLQIVEQSVGIESRLGIGAGQQLIQQRVRNAGCFASCHEEPPSDPLWPPKHEIPDTPASDWRSRYD